MCHLNDKHFWVCPLAIEKICSSHFHIKVLGATIFSSLHCSAAITSYHLSLLTGLQSKCMLSLLSGDQSQPRWGALVVSELKVTEWISHKLPDGKDLFLCILHGLAERVSNTLMWGVDWKVKVTKQGVERKSFVVNRTRMHQIPGVSGFWALSNGNRPQGEQRMG